MRKPVHGERPLHWVGTAKRELLTFPEAVKDDMGTALSVAQFGGKHPASKPWKGAGSGVLEVVQDHDGNTFRAVYTVRFRLAVYVLHCFQKKSHKGIQTPKPDVALVTHRLHLASSITRITMAISNSRIVRSSGNVFADLGLKDAAEKQTKVRLAVTINQILQRRSVSQGTAAKLLGINQPKISALSTYRLEGFSVERLMRFLTLLNQDIEIVVRNRPRARRPGRVYVTAA